MLFLDYFLFGFVVTLFYFVVKQKEVKELTQNLAVVNFFIVWIIYPAVVLFELIKFLLKYFVFDE